MQQSQGFLRPNSNLVIHSRILKATLTDFKVSSLRYFIISHHPHILVFQIMAMVQEQTFKVFKTHNDFNFHSRHKQYGIFSHSFINPYKFSAI
jgi:hypothetical protein